jgi:hypothetical protein
MISAASSLSARAWVFRACSIILTSLGLFSYWRHSTREFGVDENVYTYVGWSWQQGYWPYSQSWDHKGPFLYTLAAIRTSLLGTGGDGIRAEVLVLGILLAVVLGLIAHRLWGGYAGWIASAACAVFWTHTELWYEHAYGGPFFQTISVLIALLSAGAVLAALYRGPVAAVAAGVLGGLAFCVKPNAIAGFLIALALIASRRKASLVILASAASLIPIAAYGVAFYRAGALRALIDCYFEFNSIFGKNNLAYRGMGTLLFHGLNNLLVLGLLPVAAAFVILEAAQLPYLAVWLLLEMALMVSNGGAAYHAVPLLAPVLLAGTWLMMRALSAKRHRGAAACAAVAVLFGPPLLRAAQAHMHHVHSEENAGERRIVADLARTTGRGEEVLAFPRPSNILISAERRSAAEPYFSFRPLFVKGYTTDRRWSNLMSRLDRMPPRTAVLETYGYNGPQDLAPMVEWTFSAFDSEMPEQRDRSVVPNWENFAAFIGSRYRIDYCARQFCLLRLKNHATD